MKKIVAPISIGILFFISFTVKAQLDIESEGIFIEKGTVFHTEGLTMIPTNDFIVNNLNIKQQFSTVIWPKFSSIRRMYRFSRPTTFTGELGFNYEDVDLNGNEEKDLVLAYSKATSNNYKDYNLMKESLVNSSNMYLSQLFVTTINISDLTAVTMESSLADPYTVLEANNLITPNGDGINDTWIVKNIHMYPNNELNIFDRDGRMVFKMIGYDNLWNGQFNGNPLPEGTYYYMLYIDSGNAKKTGFISIVKD